MLCENCQRNEATIHYAEIMNGVKTEHHICSECATDMNLEYCEIFNNEFPFAKLLSGLLATRGTEQQDASSPTAHVICPKCGMNYEEFTRVGKFGCDECYNIFGPLINEYMKKLHGNTEHVGKKYKADELSSVTAHKSEKKYNYQDDIKSMKAKLQEAVLLEDYEQAAQLRDKIKEVKERNEGNV